MTWTLPAKIRRMSKRRQKTALFRYVKRGIERALHQGYRGQIVTQEIRARMVEEINNQLRMLPRPVEHININLMVLPYQEANSDSLPRSATSA